MSQLNLKAVLDRIKSGKFSTKDEAIAKKWLLNLGQEDQLKFSEGELNRISEEMWAASAPNYLTRRSTRRLWPRIAAAAAIIILSFSIGLYLISRNTKPEDFAAQREIKPGIHQAILTLSNGRKLIISPDRKGKVASESKSAISISDGGDLVYSSSGEKNDAPAVYNTLTTPIGSSSEVTLSDGTQVNLDAGSSIVYPVAFGRGERTVRITGQAYFKVKHDPLRPFSVTAKGITVNDIGTEFNINAYNDENGVKTTLIEGSVKVNTVTIQPGQQAVCLNGKINIQPADAEAVAAWKDDNFLFRNQDLQISMNQIARWYNVAIVYNHAPMDFRIWADVSRKRNLSVILKSIESTGKIKFKIDGRTVIVSR